MRISVRMAVVAQPGAGAQATRSVPEVSPWITHRQPPRILDQELSPSRRAKPLGDEVLNHLAGEGHGELVERSQRTGSLRSPRVGTADGSGRVAATDQVLEGSDLSSQPAPTE